MEYEFSGLRRKTTTQLENNINELQINLKARVLLGPIRTNASYEVESAKDQKIDSSCLHFTLEWADANTGMRFARTFFTSTLAEDNYMKDVHLTEDEDLKVANLEGKQNQKNIKFLFGSYLGLMRAFKDISHSLMVGEISADEAMGEKGI